MKTMLYPRNTFSRRALDLNGLWKIYFDFEGDGRKRGLQNGIPGKEMIPVPASFADFYTDKELRDFCGDVWYETSFFVPAELQGSIVELRFGAVAHRAAVGFVKRAGTAMFTAAGSGKRQEAGELFCVSDRCAAEAKSSGSA